MEKELTGTGRAELYTNLNKLIMKISDYICREEDVVRERLGETMGGKAMGELQGEMRQMVFCDITREHPAEIYSKPGCSLRVTGEAV